MGPPGAKSCAIPMLACAYATPTRNGSVAKLSKPTPEPYSGEHHRKASETPRAARVTRRRPGRGIAPAFGTVHAAAPCGRPRVAIGRLSAVVEQSRLHRRVHRDAR